MGMQVMAASEAATRDAEEFVNFQPPTSPLRPLFPAFGQMMTFYEFYYVVTSFPFVMLTNFAAPSS
jgi:hypothetical protein